MFLDALMANVVYRGKSITFPDGMSEYEISQAMPSVAEQIDSDFAKQESKAQEAPQEQSFASFAKDAFVKAITPESKQKSVVAGMDGKVIDDRPAIERKGAPITDEAFNKVKSAYENTTPKKRTELANRQDWLGSVASEVDKQYEAITEDGIGDKRKEAKINKITKDTNATFETAKNMVEQGVDENNISTIANGTPQREIIDYALDTVRSVAKIAPTTGKMTTDLLGLGTAYIPVVGDMIMSLGESFDAAVKYQTEKQSPELRQKAFEMQEISKNGTGVQLASFLLANPDVLSDVAIPSLGFTLASGGVGAGVTKLATEKATANLTTKFAGRNAEAIKTLALRYGKQTGTQAAIALNVGVNAGGAFSEAEGDANAKYTAAFIAGVATLVGGKLTKGGAEGAIARGAGDKGSLSSLANRGVNAAKVGGNEMLQEYIEGGGQALGVQAGEVAFGEREGFNLSQINNQGILESIAAAGPGAIIGAAQGGNNKQDRLIVGNDPADAIADNAVAQQLQAEFDAKQAEADTALANITNPDISVDEAIALAEKAVDIPTAPSGLLSTATQAIQADDILEDNNVSTDLSGNTGSMDSRAVANEFDNATGSADFTSNGIDATRSQINPAGFGNNLSIGDGNTLNDTVGLSTETQPLLQKEVLNGLQQEGQEAAQEIKLQQPRQPRASKPKTLLATLRDLGGVKLSEKQDVTGEAKGFAPGGYNQIFKSASKRSLKGLIEDGGLDEYLPYNMRLENNGMNDDAFDSTEAYDYLSDYIRNGQPLLPYAVIEELNAIAYQERAALDDINSELTEDEINEQFTIATNEERESFTDAQVIDTESEDGVARSSEGNASGIDIQVENVTPQVSEKVRPIVERIVKRRNAAQQLNKEQSFDNLLSNAKSILAGEKPNISKLKIALASFNNDTELKSAINDLIQSVQAPLSDARKTQKQLSESYKAQIQVATTTAEIDAIAKAIQDDVQLSDANAQLLDDLAFDRLDALEVTNDIEESPSLELTGQTNEEILANEQAQKAADEAKSKADAKAKADEDKAALEAQQRKNAKERPFEFGEDVKETEKAIKSGVDDLFSEAKSDDAKKEKAQADLDSALGDLGDIFGKSYRKNITQEQEQKLIPVLTRVFDAAFRLGFIEFKDAAKFVIETIRNKIGADIAETINIDQLQGSYISMAGKYGDKATSKKDVVNVETIEEILQGNQNARVSESENLPARGAQSDLLTEQSGRGDSEQVDSGVAAESNKSARDESVSSSVSSASGSGTSSAVRNDGDESPSGSREASNARDNASAADVENFEITESTATGEGSAAQKYKNNIAAIKIVKTLEAEKRLATPQEREVLAKYAGFGALSGVFDKNNAKFSKEYAELKELLTPSEYEAARASILNAYFTSPTIVKTMYDGLAKLGFKSGRILEPSMGSGNFFGMMPASMRNKSSLNGVELDVITSRLAKHLYPNANIATETGFEAYEAPEGYFDLVISNPPFGSEKLTDSAKRGYSGFSIHNYFIAKSIDKLRDGGVMAVVVSHNFMDAQNTQAREWISKRANLLGAVRLPQEAFKDIAGTDVITDILYFQKTKTPEQSPKWIEAYNNGDYSFSNYFISNPKNVLGETVDTTNQFGKAFTVKLVSRNGTLQQQLKGFNDSLPDSVYVEPESRIEVLDSADNTVPDGVKVGTYYKDESGFIRQRMPDTLGTRRSQAWESPNAKAQERMEAMMTLRDLLRNQMRVERAPLSNDKEIEANRKQLNTTYDKFLKEFGHLNNITNRRLFLDDTESALVQALEMDYDQGVTKSKALATGMEAKEPSAEKADIFSRRVLFPPSDSITVNNAKDALLASLNVKGGVDIDYMMEVYKKSQDEIVSELDDVLFNDPQKGYVTADSYLSGDVKTKLAEAQNAAKADGAFKKNVEALEKVIPKDKLPSEIFASPGANWIPADVYQAFASEITGINKDNVEYVYLPSAAIWLNEKNRSGDAGKMTSDYGTTSIDSFELFGLLINGKSAEVKKSERDANGNVRSVVDIQKTDEARAKYQKIKEFWNSWIFSDAERADRLAAIYNDKHNRIVARAFDGGHMQFYGMTPSIQLLTSQKNVVWRAIQDRNALLDHVVGAGKTFAMTSIAMEMKRLGIARKPLFVVPNHLTLQWRSDFTRLYPASNILAATPEDFTKDRRQKMFAKMVTGDYDAIVIGHSSIKKVGLPADVEEKMYDEQVREIADAIEIAKTAKGDRGITRDMEKIKTNLEAKIKKLKEKAGTKDDVVSFDELGVDAMFIDEMHEFKNLFFTTQMQRTAGLGTPAGSGKALDLFMKIRYMQQTIGENAPLITATGTPVSNSLAEMFTMQRYMKYDEMKRADLHMFDAWAKQYGEVENVYEVAPSGVGYRQSTRFSKFKNLPSLMSSYTSFADIITLQDLKDQSASQGKVFPVPKLKTGKPINVIAKRSDLQRDYFGIPKLAEDENGNILFELDPNTVGIEVMDNGKYRLSHPNGFSDFETMDEARLDLVAKSLTPKTFIEPESLLGKFANLANLTRESKGKINALSLTGLANKAGLDFRIIDPSAPDFADSKINLAVKNMFDLWSETKKDRGTQIVFCDMSVPASARSGAANAERFALVRDRNNSFVHKKATLHTVEGFEGFPFYISQSGSGNNKSFAVYEPLSGLIMREGFISKQDAKDFMQGQVDNDAGRDRIFAMRDRNETITKDNIDEYFAEQEKIEIADDGGNLITPEDLESIAGSSKFSVYDDIKAKLLSKGVPENEIAFIHDYNTPNKKDDLFKRVNRGEVRFLFGSTPKLGAGTNVQKRLVGLHHIDAPWRPSDLEQREGRIIRQGNELYQRDPEGFEASVYRYATEQTYDTRRWQLLEHKAAGIEQLRKYTGEAEIDDVASEASNSADMKAAASGNPLILEETKLRTEVKRLLNLEKSHSDSKFAMGRKIKQNERSVNEYLPQKIAEYEGMISEADAIPLPSDKEKVALTIVDGKRFTDKAGAENAIAALALKTRQAFNMGDLKVINYRGVEFTIERGQGFGSAKLSSPDGTMHTYLEKEGVSPSGLFVRFNNYIDSFGARIEQAKSAIQVLEKETRELKPRLNESFESADLLKATQANHAKVQRKLMKSSQLEAVPDNQRADFDRLLKKQRDSLIALGYSDVIETSEAEDAPSFKRTGAPFFSYGAGSVISLNKSKSQIDARILNKALVNYGLGEEWGNAYETVDVPDALVAYKEEIQTAFGRDVRFVAPTAERFNIFNGVQIPSAPKAVYVNAEAEVNLTAIAGHELYHTIERTRPDLHKFFKEEAKEYFVNFPEYKARLNKYLQNGEKEYTDDKATSELLADFMGDALADPIFLKKLADKNKLKFNGLLRAVVNFLNNAISNLKNLGSSKYISDVETLRDKLADLLNAYATGATIDGVLQGPMFSRTQSPQTNLNPEWQVDETSKMDNVIRVLQDKFIDLKRATQAIKKSGVEITDRWNAYLQEELYHGRTAKRVQDFINQDLTPLMEDMRMRGVGMAEFEEYLWMRHAPERNAQMAKINEGNPDGLAGVSTADAESYLSALDPVVKKRYEALAKRIDAINKKSRQVLVDYGIESQATINAMESAYKFYVPLMREDMERGTGAGTGSGFKVKGNSTKRALGSNRAVVDIIANIAQNFEKNVIRGEKNRVATAMIGLAKLNPNDEIWQVETPPTIRHISKATGFVETRTDPMFKNRPNVIVARIVNKRGEIEERSVTFNEFNERAMNMAKALNNLDVDQVSALTNFVGGITRYFSSINTQYNPIFGVINITRDVQGAMLNLTTTAIAGKQKEVLANVMPAIRGIYGATRSETGVKNPFQIAFTAKQKAEAQAMRNLWEEFQSEGGTTGFKDMFANAQERTKALNKALDPDWWTKTLAGKVVTVNGVLTVPESALNEKLIKPVFDWLSDYNQTLENSVRLSAYKVARDNGISKQQAASIAKNISVNFNRKGTAGRGMGAWYAFYNAAVQGTARIGETLTGPKGKQIIAGGIAIGSAQAILLAMAGFDDEDPPEFVRSTNFIIPAPSTDKGYVTIPMPLGFNVLPNVGRIITEWALSGGEDTTKRVFSLFGAAMESFNPLGGNGRIDSIIMPTVADPFNDLSKNEDFTGRAISQKDFNSSRPTPGFTRTRDRATELSVSLAQFINNITGGDDYTKGEYSPTGDQIEYLVGQLTGGVGRELVKITNTIESIVTGEELPTYKMPLVGRFIGNSSSQAPQSNKFYSNVEKINVLESGVLGRMRDGKDAEKFMEENPLVNFIDYGKKAQNAISKLTRYKRELIKQDASRDEVKLVENEITKIMLDFNEAIKEQKNAK